MTSQLWDDLLAEGFDKLFLVAPDIVNVNLVEAQVDELLQIGAMLIQVGRDQHAVLVVLGLDQLGDLGEILGRADVGLRERHAAIRPLGQRVLQRLLVGIRPG